jgi:hypothetical protein
MPCPICEGEFVHTFRHYEDVLYFECLNCECLFADPEFLKAVDDGTARNYDSRYWEMEVSAARERSFGSSPSKVAELFLYSRIPIMRFVDVGSGPGYLLDSLSMLMPSSANDLYAVEMFPPPEGHRTTHPHYVQGRIGDAPGVFEAGTCIEVIEHLTPRMLDGLAQQLASKSIHGSLFYFGSAQPSFVKETDPNYLDPHRRGHIVSYSVQGVRKIFEPHGFNIIPLHGRDWAFLAEYGAPKEVSADDLLDRIWHPVKENKIRLEDPNFGPMMYAMGLESARCYLEHAIAVQRTQWALRLNDEIDALRGRINPQSKSTKKQANGLEMAGKTAV